jgi:hypothetical protein
LGPGLITEKNELLGLFRSGIRLRGLTEERIRLASPRYQFLRREQRWDSQEGHLHHRGPTVLGHPVSRDEREPRPSARISRK